MKCYRSQALYSICSTTNPDWERKSVVANEEAETAHVENDWEDGVVSCCPLVVCEL